MPLFKCWYDTAGSEKDRQRTVLVTAGVIAKAEKWARFDVQWMSAVSDYGVTELHMRHFAHSEGQYEHFRGKEDVRAEFLRRLIEIAKRNINKAFVTALPLADYDT